MIRLTSESAELFQPELLGDALQRIEKFARISHASEGDGSCETTRKFIKAVVIDHGDWSVVEHVSATAVLTVDRGVSHELVRHRLASYTQSSTRFINYAKKIEPEFIYPLPVSGSFDSDWIDAVTASEEAYRLLISKGFRPQEARSVLPNCLSTKIAMTCNLRNWRHFLIMRTSLEAHPQIRRVSTMLLSEFKQTVPLLFDDIMPGQRQAENLRLPR